VGKKGRKKSERAIRGRGKVHRDETKKEGGKREGNENPPHATSNPKIKGKREVERQGSSKET